MAKMLGGIVIKSVAEISWQALCISQFHLRPGPRAVQNLQMPHPRDWQGGQMPRSSPGAGDWVELTDALLQWYK